MMVPAQNAVHYMSSVWWRPMAHRHTICGPRESGPAKSPRLDDENGEIVRTSGGSVHFGVRPRSPQTEARVGGAAGCRFGRQGPGSTSGGGGAIPNGSIENSGVGTGGQWRCHIPRELREPYVVLQSTLRGYEYAY